MYDALDITDEEAEGLAEIARLDLAMARDFARRAQAADDADEANGLARSYQRAARSYRQTLALKVRLKRDLMAAHAGAPAAPGTAVVATPPRPAGGAAIARRVGEVRTGLLRLAWDEAEPPETEDDENELREAVRSFAARRLVVEQLIDEDRRRPDPCAEPVDDHVARLALDLDFTPQAIARWRDLPDPPPAALDALPFDDDDWESSA